MSTHVRFLLARNLHSRSPWFPERLGTARFPGAQGRAVQNGVQEVRLIFCPVNIQKEVDNHTHRYIHTYTYIYINCPKGGFPSGFPPKNPLAYGIVEYFRISSGSFPGRPCTSSSGCRIPGSSCLPSFRCLGSDRTLGTFRPKKVGKIGSKELEWMMEGQQLFQGFQCHDVAWLKHDSLVKLPVFNRFPNFEPLWGTWENLRDPLIDLIGNCDCCESIPGSWSSKQVSQSTVPDECSAQWFVGTPQRQWTNLWSRP